MDLLISALIMIVLGIFFYRSIQKDRSAGSGLTTPRPPKNDLPSLDQLHGAGTEAALKNKLKQHAQKQNDSWLKEAGFELNPEKYADDVILGKRQFEANPYIYRYQPPIVLLAEPRATTEIETGGSSWLGGLPSLGDQPWPRSRDGSPMHPVAQLNLATLASVDTPEGLPKSGSLAFFLDLTAWPYSGAVTYVPETNGRLTQPIKALPRLAARTDDHGKEIGGYALKGYSGQNAPRVFPRWPISFVPLEVDEETNPDDDPAAEEIWKLLPETRSTYYLLADNYKDTYPTIMTPSKWHTAQKFANSVTLSREQITQKIQDLRKCVDTPTTRQDEKFIKERQKIEALQPAGDESSQELGERKDELLQKLEEKLVRYKHLHDRQVRDLEFMTANAQAFVAFEEEVATWAFAQDQWTNMNAKDVSQLVEYMARVNKGYFDETPGFHLFMDRNPGMSSYVNQTLLEMIRGPREIYEQIPQQIRDDFDRKALFQRLHDRHKMFGGYPTIHALECNEGAYLLLSLGSDYLLGWEWGHGPATFHISPEDLANQRWENVNVAVGYQ